MAPRRYLNSLTPGRCGCNFKNIFKLISWIDTLSASRKTVVRWMPQNSADDKSTLVQVMAWCHQATSHYLSQCWPRSLSPYGVTRPQWVNQSWLIEAQWHSPEGNFPRAASVLFPRCQWVKYHLTWHSHPSELWLWYPWSLLEESRPDLAPHATQRWDAPTDTTPKYIMSS